MQIGCLVLLVLMVFKVQLVRKVLLDLKERLALLGQQVLKVLSALLVLLDHRVLLVQTAPMEPMVPLRLLLLVRPLLAQQGHRLRSQTAVHLLLQSLTSPFRKVLQEPRVRLVLKASKVYKVRLVLLALLVLLMILLMLLLLLLLLINF